MRSRDLVAEYCHSLRLMTFADLQALLAIGIPIATVRQVCPVPASIRLVDRGGERFEPDIDGAPAWVFPATCIDPRWPELLEALDPRRAVSGGEIIDLVAFSPAVPQRWALRTGDAITVGAIEHQYWFPKPTQIHRNVVSWLRAGCEGVVLLTSNPYEAARVLRGIAVIEAEDKDHAAELQRLLHMPTPSNSTILTRRKAAA
jgi:hypothetical protein